MNQPDYALQWPARPEGLLEEMEMSEPPRPPRDRVGPVRLRQANRDQVVPVPAYLDALLPEDHLARLVWAAVERLDWSAFTAEQLVVEGGPGRAAADPQVLGALWLYATSQGVTSARALADEGAASPSSRARCSHSCPSRR